MGLTARSACAGRAFLMLMNKFTSIVLILISFAAYNGAAHAGLKVLEGEHTVVYDIVNPRGVAFIPDYSNESFEQKVLSQDEFSKRVRVTTKLHALRTRIPYPIPADATPRSAASYLLPEKDRQSGDAAIIATVREVTRGSRFM